MTTRKPKPTPLYAMDAPSQWLQVVTSVVDQDPATVCRKQWQCRQGAVVDAPPVTRRVRLH
jgi:hypothetical protein